MKSKEQLLQSIYEAETLLMHARLALRYNKKTDATECLVAAVTKLQDVACEVAGEEIL